MSSFVKISEIADIFSGGGAPQDANDFSVDGIPFLRAGSLPKLLGGAKENDLEKITKEVAKKHSLHLHSKGSIVFAKSGMSATKGHIYRLKDDCYVVNHLAVLRPNANCDSKYLMFALKQYSPTVLIIDAAYPSIRLSDISDFKIPLPNLAEQKRIAAILDKAADIKAKREEAITKINKLINNTFTQFFEINKRYEHRKLSDVCELITDGTHYTPSYADDGVIFLSAKNVTSGRIDWENIKHIPNSLHLELQKRVSPRRGDVLLAKNGTTGVAAIVDKDIIFDIYVSLALLRPGSNLLPGFLHAALNSTITKRQFNKALKGIGVPNLHLIDIRKTTIPFPTIGEQKEFINVIRSINACRDLNLNYLHENTNLINSLQSQLFDKRLN